MFVKTRRLIACDTGIYTILPFEDILHCNKILVNVSMVLFGSVYMIIGVRFPRKEYTLNDYSTTIGINYNSSWNKGILMSQSLH